jgi:hypothetical protein
MCLDIGVHRSQGAAFPDRVRGANITTSIADHYSRRSMAVGVRAGTIRLDFVRLTRPAGASIHLNGNTPELAEREGFEPSKGF